MQDSTCVRALTRLQLCIAPLELLLGVVADLAVVHAEHMVLQLDDPDVDVPHQPLVHLPQIILQGAQQQSECHTLGWQVTGIREPAYTDQKVRQRIF
jgi:hypothetical protein